jgi:predicted permease
MGTGFYSKKIDLLDENVNRKLSGLLLKITNPLLVISSFQVVYEKELMISLLIVFIFSVAAHTLSSILSQLLFIGYGESKKKIMKFSAIYSNCGFVGFPILDSLFGSTGILLGSVYVAVFNIFLWTNGVVIFRKEKTLGKAALVKAFINPGIISVLTGLVLFIFSIDLPYPLTQSIHLIGSMTIPLSMLIVGANIANCKLSTLFKGIELYFSAFVRLLLIPVLVYLIMKLLGFSDMLLSTCVLLVAMPAAATTTIFAEMYDGDTSFASRVVAFTTLLSTVTIPLIMLLIQ